ncbi:MAG TPA: hypothetical protein VGF55_25645, partial [Gemmataceae bacterium]
ILSAGLFVPPTLAADDNAVAKQKQAADANYKALQLAPVGRAESTNFLLYGTLPDARLKVLAANLEKQSSTAARALQFDKDSKPWTGKLTVYVFADRGQFRSFVRQIEKRSPDEGEQSSVNARGDMPHLAVSPGQGKESPTAEAEAGYRVAATMLMAKAKGTELPEWLTLGFARATAAQAVNSPAGVRKRAARQLAGRLKPADAWNDMLSIEQRLPLATSVADYLFYGKGLAKPGDFLLAFRPDDDKPMKTVWDALEAVKTTQEQFEAGYVKWLRGNS